MVTELEQLYIVCDKLDSLNLGFKKGTTKDLLNLELLKFLLHINDNKLDSKELVYIRNILGFSHSNKNLQEIRDRFNTKNLGIPNSFKFMILSDTKGTLKAYPLKTQLFLKVYEIVGTQFIACNNNEDLTEIDNLTKYLESLKKYANEFNLGFSVNLDKKEENIEETESLDKLLEDLNSLVGLDGVKNDVNELINLIKVQECRVKNGLKPITVSKHMVFSGPPGTGKTTVARLLAKIYKQMGVCSKGHLVEVDRSGLVVGYVGQTATKVKKVVDSSLGGILFIDEAYSLIVGKGDGDFGQEAVDTLLKSMEDHRDDLIVIVAGYTELMEQFLSSNPGLKSRFNKFIEFENFTNSELMEIIKNQALDKDYILDKSAIDYLTLEIEKMTSNKTDDFANARTMRNLLEKAITNQASRIINIENPDKEVLSILIAEDFIKD